MLTKKGHKVAFAVDGEDFLKVMRVDDGGEDAVGGGCGGALHLTASSKQAFAAFDVVLIDRHMPKLEGPEAIR